MYIHPIYIPVLDLADNEKARAIREITRTNIYIGPIRMFVVYKVLYEF